MKLVLMIVLSTMLLFVTACKLGIGSEHVGQWREQRVTQFDVCVEDDQGQCAEQHEQVQTEPARDFFGAQILWGNAGVASSSYQGNTKTTLRGELGFEYLMGHGDKALGLRGSILLDSSVSVPLTLMAHWGPSTRFSFFAGAGYVPYSRLTILGDTSDKESSLLGGRLLAGMKFVGSRYKNETRWVWTIEVDKRWVHFSAGTFDSLGLTFNAGPSF